MSDEVDEILITLVEQYPHLYKKDCKGFKDEILKENSWHAISTVINRSDEYVQKRWYSLRDRFVRAYREKQEIPPSGCGVVPDIRSNFPYLKQMLWLAPHIRKRRTVDNFTHHAKVPKRSETSQQILKVPAHTSVSTNDSCESQWDSFNLIVPDTQIDQIDSENEPSCASSPLSLSPNETLLFSNTPSTSKNFKSTEPPPDNFYKQRKNKVDKLAESLTQVAQSFSKFTQKQNSPAPQVARSGNEAFMASVVADMDCLTKINQVRFKRQVLTFLEELMEQEANK